MSHFKNENKMLRSEQQVDRQALRMFKINDTLLTKHDNNG